MRSCRGCRHLSARACCCSGVCVGPPVAAHFEYLGVDQQIGRRREGRLAADRVAVRGRLSYSAVWHAMGSAQDMRVMAAVDVPAARYGIGQSALTTLGVGSEWGSAGSHAVYLYSGARSLQRAALPYLV